MYLVKFPTFFNVVSHDNLKKNLISYHMQEPTLMVVAAMLGSRQLAAGYET